MMYTYNIAELELLICFKYLFNPIILIEERWYNGYEPILELTDEYTQILLSEIDISVSDAELKQFLRRNNTPKTKRFWGKQPDIEVQIPKRTELGFSLLDYFEGTYSDYSYMDFRVDYSVGLLCMTTSRGKNKQLSFYSNNRYIDAIGIRYPEIKDLVEDFRCYYTMARIAGTNTNKVVETTENIIYSDSFNRSSLLRMCDLTIATSLGLVLLGLYSRTSVEDFIFNSHTLTAPLDELELESVYEDNTDIIRVQPRLFHSIEVVNGELKIWVICSIYTDVHTLYGRLPLRYCMKHTSESGFTLTVTTHEGSISLEYEMIKYLNSDFTLDEVFDVVPSRAEIQKKIFKNCLGTGYLQ